MKAISTKNKLVYKQKFIRNSPTNWKPSVGGYTFGISIQWRVFQQRKRMIYWYMQQYGSISNYSKQKKSGTKQCITLYDSLTRHSTTSRTGLTEWKSIVAWGRRQKLVPNAQGTFEERWKCSVCWFSSWSHGCKLKSHSVNNTVCSTIMLVLGNVNLLQDKSKNF